MATPKKTSKPKATTLATLNELNAHKPPATTFAIVADVHLGNRQMYGGQYKDGLNDRGRLSLKTFALAVEAARKAKATHLIVAGDLFDSNNPEPAVVAGVQKILHKDCADLGVIIVPGNHDMRDASPDSESTACEGLQFEGTIVRGSHAWFALPGLDLLCIPFTSEEPMGERVERILKLDVPGQLGVPKVLVAHVGVYGDGAPPWCKTARDGMHASRLLSALEATPIEHAYVGNYHLHGEWASKTRTVTQVGTLCPGSFSDLGLFPDVGGLALPGRMVEVPGPRFLKLPAGWAIPEAEDCTVFVRSPGEVTGTAHSVELIPEAPEVPGTPATPDVQDGAEAIVEYATAKKLDTKVLDLAKQFWTRAT